MPKSNLFATLGALVLLATCGQAQAGNFTLCKGTYALCTTAACTPVPERTMRLLRLRGEDWIFRRAG